MDLRKLQLITHCELTERYEKLLSFYEAEQFEEEAMWTRGLLQKIMEARDQEKKKKPFLEIAEEEPEKPEGKRSSLRRMNRHPLI